MEWFITQINILEILRGLTGYSYLLLDGMWNQHMKGMKYWKNWSETWLEQWIKSTLNPPLCTSRCMSWYSNKSIEVWFSIFMKIHEKPSSITLAFCLFDLLIVNNLHSISATHPLQWSHRVITQNSFTFEKFSLLFFYQIRQFCLG